VDERDLGVAGGAQQMISQMGVVVGTQVMFTVEQASLGPWGATAVGDIPDPVFATAYDHGYLVGALAAALAIGAAVFVRSTTKAGRLTGFGRHPDGRPDDDQGAVSAARGPGAAADPSELAPA
jgi:hypothetical protein